MLLSCQIERVETRSLTLLPFRLPRGKFLTLSPPYSKPQGVWEERKLGRAGKSSHKAKRSKDVVSRNKKKGLHLFLFFFFYFRQESKLATNTRVKERSPWGTLLIKERNNSREQLEWKRSQKGEIVNNTLNPKGKKAYRTQQILKKGYFQGENQPQQPTHLKRRGGGACTLSFERRPKGHIALKSVTRSLKNEIGAMEWPNGPIAVITRKIPRGKRPVCTTKPVE